MEYYMDSENMSIIVKGDIMSADMELKNGSDALL